MRKLGLKECINLLGEGPVLYQQETNTVVPDYSLVAAWKFEEHPDLPHSVLQAGGLRSATNPGSAQATAFS